MEVVTAGHVYMGEEVLDPYRGISCSVVRFDIHGLKPVWDFVLHYFVCEAKRVCGGSILGYTATYLRWSPFAVFGPGVARFVMYE